VRQVSDADEILFTALRVLTAICEHRGYPDIVDVETLRCYAPALANGPIDQLAREIILNAIDERRKRLDFIARGAVLN
jgi:hypothetical protein